MINGNTKVSELLDESENQNELEHKANEHGAIDKNFYEKLPTYYPEIMENLDKDFYGRPWFEEAWKKYRDHVMNSETKNIRAPGYIFNSYIKKDHELNPTQVRMGLTGDYYLFPELRSKAEREADCKEVCYSEEDINSLKHYGVKGMKWGIRKEEEEAKQREFKRLQSENQLMIAQRKNVELKETPQKERQRKLDEEQKKLFELHQAEVKSVQDIGKGVQEVGKSVENIIPNVPGKTIRGRYPDMSNQQLQEKINRMQLEQRYSDLKGDTKYVKSGQEKTREAIQTITGAVGLATSVITLALLFKGDGRKKLPDKKGI